MSKLTEYGTLTELDMETIREAIRKQIPDGEYERDYNCAVTNELRIMVKRRDCKYSERYVAKDYGGLIKLIHKP